MNRPTNRTDEAINTVLIGLRDIEVPAGMENRILRELGARQQSRSRASLLSFPRGIRFSSPSRPQWKPASGFVAAGVALASLLFAVSFLHSTRHKALPLSPQSSATSTESHLLNASGDPHRPSPNYVPSRSIHATKAAAALPSQPLSDEDPLALSEMLAPSKPAPPLPLTPQEKMLAEVVHRGEPEELASLSPDVRARQMELSQAEFHAFFEPPPAKDNE